MGGVRRAEPTGCPSPSQGISGRLTLLFDGDCGFCTACAVLLRALDRKHRVSVTPFQAPGACAALGLSPQECEAAAWVAAEGRGPVRGAEAILLALAAATGVGRLARLYLTPSRRRCADSAYAWFARQRGRLPGLRPYCQTHPAECGRGAHPAGDS